MRLNDCYNFHDFRNGQRRLPGPIFDYIDGAADDETTSGATPHASRAATSSRMYCAACKAVDMSVTVMGQKLAMPIYCSPTALQRLFHHTGRARGGRRRRKVRHDVRRVVARHG